MTKMVGLRDENGRQREVRTHADQTFRNQHGRNPPSRLAAHFFGSQELNPRLQRASSASFQGRMPLLPRNCAIISRRSELSAQAKLNLGQPSKLDTPECRGTVREHQLAGIIASQRSFARMQPSYPSKRTNTHWAPYSWCYNLCASSTGSHVHLCSSRII